MGVIAVILIAAALLALIVFLDRVYRNLECDCYSEVFDSYGRTVHYADCRHIQIMKGIES